MNECKLLFQLARQLQFSTERHKQEKIQRIVKKTIPEDSKEILVAVNQTYKDANVIQIAWRDCQIIISKYDLKFKQTNRIMAFFHANQRMIMENLQANSIFLCWNDELQYLDANKFLTIIQNFVMMDIMDLTFGK